MVLERRPDGHLRSDAAMAGERPFAGFFCFFFDSISRFFRSFLCCCCFVVVVVVVSFLIDLSQLLFVSSVVFLSSFPKSAPYSFFLPCFFT